MRLGGETGTCILDWKGLNKKSIPKFTKVRLTAKNSV